jgi:hypothetical protein
VVTSCDDEVLKPSVKLMDDLVTERAATIRSLRVTRIGANGSKRCAPWLKAFAAIHHTAER